MPTGETLAEQQAATEDSLAHYQPIWSDYRNRVRRTDGGDSNLNLEFGVVNNHMNFLLERFFELTSGVELEAIAVAVPVDGRGFE